MTTISSKYLTTTEVAKHLNMDYKKLIVYIKTGELPAYQFGSRGRFRIDPEDLNEFKNKFRVIPVI